MVKSNDPLGTLWSMSDDLGRLAGTAYLLLTTFRRDGTPVPTPVWVARDGDELVVWTAPSAGKLKRIRRDPTVRVGECGVRGEPRGESVTGTARVVRGAEARRIRELVRRKYGLIGWITVRASQLRRRGNTAGVAIRL